MARRLALIIFFLGLQLPLRSTAAVPPMTVDLDILIFSGTAWTEERLAERLGAINRVYAQCAVSLGHVAVQTINPPTGEVNLYRDLAVEGPGGLRAAAIALGPTPSLTLVLIRQFQEGLAGTAGIPRAYENSFPEMVNRAWVTEEIFEPTYTNARDAGYVTEAHELAHILLNDNHLPAGQKGLMAARPEDVKGALSSNECAAIRASKFTH